MKFQFQFQNYELEWELTLSGKEGIGIRIELITKCLNSLEIPYQFLFKYIIFSCLVQADPSNYSDLEKLIHDFFLNLRHTAVFSSCIGFL